MPTNNNAVREAFNSMLRTDYIALSDTAKLRLLGQYFVDYFGYLPQVLSPNDQLIVGRRGTGKTTLLYRVLVECMKSWVNNGANSQAPSRTLAIYIDLSKCHSLSEISGSSFTDFEHVFVSETCDAIKEELTRSWPQIAQRPTLLMRIFDYQHARQIDRVRDACRELADIITAGVPRFFDESGTVKEKTTDSQSETYGIRASSNAVASLSASDTNKAEL